MFVYMARAVIQDKEKSRAIHLTLLDFIGLKSITCQLATHVENLLKIEISLNVICLTKVHLKCNKHKLC